MTNAPFATAEDFHDIESVNHYADRVAAGDDPESMPCRRFRAVSRDNARSPMQWDATSYAGFAAGQPWAAVNPNHVDVNARRRLPRPRLGFPGSMG